MKIFKRSTIILLLCIGQITFAQDRSYSEMVVENPTAEEDLQLVADYLDALVSNKMQKAANFLADDFVISGPSYQETKAKKEYLESWTESHKQRTNEKNNFVRQTFRVLEGDNKGDWVSIWGTYSYTRDGIDINVPYQMTLLVANGKITRVGVYYDNLAVSEALGYELTEKKE